MAIQWLYRIFSRVVLFQVLLLVCLQSRVYAGFCQNPPCECSFDDNVSGNSAICRVNNYTTIVLSWLKSHKTQYRPELTITCKGIKDFVCFEFPQFDITHYRLKVKSCPTALLGCINGETRQPTATIDKLETENLFGNFTPKDFKNLVSITDMKINLRGGDPLPLSAIRNVPWNSEVTVAINGGNFNLPPNIFDNTPQLKEFVLENNNINRLLDDSLKGLNCKKFKIFGNTFERIIPGTFEGVSNLEELNLEENKLKYIERGAFGSKSMKVLLLQKNYIQNLPNGFLSGLPSLQKVQVLSNKADITLDNFVFSHLPSSVEFVELYNSKLLYLTDTLFSKSSSIKTLKMHETKITELPKNIFSDLVSLTLLNLSGNNIRYVSSEVFAKLKKLGSLNMNFNQLTTLADNQFSFSPNLKILLLSENRISSLNMLSFVGSNLEKITLLGNGIRTLNGDASAVWANLKILHLGGNKLKSFEIIYGLKNLGEADFSRNEIKSIRENKTYFFSTKMGLDLRRNLISEVIRDPTILPEHLKGGNITLYLSNNPLECDCSLTTVFHEWHKAGILERFEDISCSDEKAISEISPFTLCNRKHALIAMIGTSVVGTLILILLLISIIANWKKIWTYILDALERDDSNDNVEIEMGPQEEKPYDIFISFAHQDEKFVTDDLLPKLEKDFGLKVCVHYRDWVVGELITDQIQESVKNSKMTVIILTENFLMSEWSYLEFRTAHNLSIEDGIQRVILILLDESVSRDERLSNDLKTYISVNTYLLWNDIKFWDRLKKVLPKPEMKSEKLKISK